MDYLSLIQARDLLEQPPLVAELIHQIHQIQQAHQPVDPSVLNKALEDELFQTKQKLIQLSGSSITLQNKLSDTKEMLFEAEQSLLNLNTLHLTVTKQNKELVLQLAQFNESQVQIQFYKEYSSQLKHDLDFMNKQMMSKGLELSEIKMQLQKENESKEHYVATLLKSQMQQAEMLDQANEMHAEGLRIKQEYTKKLKELDCIEHAGNKSTREIVSNIDITQQKEVQKVQETKQDPKSSFAEPINFKSSFATAQRSQTMAYYSDFSEGKKGIKVELPSIVYSKRKAHEQGCSSLVFNPSSFGQIATGGCDGYVRLWDVGTVNDPTQAKLHNCKAISTLAFSRSGAVLACAGTDLEITLMRVNGQGLQKQGKILHGHTDTINGIHFTGGQKLLSVSSDRTIRFWDAETGQQDKSIAQTSAIHALNVEDQVFITGHKTGDIKVWSLSQMKLMHALEKVHDDKIEHCVMAGRNIVSIGRDNQIKVVDFYTQKVLQTIEHADLIVPQAGCKFSISGKYLAVGSADGSVLVFDYMQGCLEEVYQEHQAPVVACEWDPNSQKRLVTVDTVGNMLVWD